jgi:hypothetical protein
MQSEEGPLNKKRSSCWKGHKCDVKVEWENGEVSCEPLHAIAADDPVTCAIHAKDNGPPDADGGWNHFRSLAKRAKKMLCVCGDPVKSGHARPASSACAVPRSHKTRQASWQRQVAECDQARDGSTSSRGVRHLP